MKRILYRIVKDNNHSYILYYYVQSEDGKLESVFKNKISELENVEIITIAQSDFIQKVASIPLKWGLTLRKIRVEHNIKLKDFAKIVNTDYGYYSRVENGEINISVEQLEKMLNAFNYTLKEVLLE